MRTIRICSFVAILAFTYTYLFWGRFDLIRLASYLLTVLPFGWIMVRSFASAVVAEGGTLTYRGLFRTSSWPVSAIHLIEQSDADIAADNGWFYPRLQAAPEIVFEDGRSVTLVALGGHTRTSWETVQCLSTWIGLQDPRRHTCNGPLLSLENQLDSGPTRA
jgi:hypothetical protein